MKYEIYNYDIPDNLVELFNNSKDIFIDTEALGLNVNRDRLCSIQLYINNSKLIIVHYPKKIYDKSSNLKKILSNKDIAKVMHFARQDMLIIYKYLNVLMENIKCTKVYSKVAQTYTDRHSFKELCQRLLQANISKTEQCSYWGDEILTDGQAKYACGDVIYLPPLVEKLEYILKREDRLLIAESLCNILPNIVFIEANHYDPVLLLNHH